MSALSDLENVDLRDVSVDGDVRDDPQWQALLGEDPAKAFPREMAAKHLPGQHPQQAHAGVDVLDVLGALDDLTVYQGDEYLDNFGDEIYSESTESGLSPRFFADGTTHLALDLEDGNFQVLADLDNSENMRDLARDLDAIVNLEVEDFDEEDEDGIVDRSTNLNTGLEIARYSTGDVRITHPDGPVMDLSEEEADELAEVLRSVADSWDTEFELTGAKTTRVRGVKHGSHDQSSHGRRGPGMPSVAVPAKPVEESPPKPPARPAKPPKPRADKPPRASTPRSRPTRAATDDTPAAPAEPRQPPKTGTEALKATPIKDRRGLVRHFGEMGSLPIEDAMVDYADQGYQHVNYVLRAGNGNTDELPDSVPGDSGLIPSHYSAQRVKKMLDGLDAAMDKSKLTADVQVFRGVGKPGKTFGPAWQESGDNTGMTWVDHGYGSTTANESAVTKFAGYGAGVRMNITVPAGTPAIGIPTSMARIKAERELLLDRGLRYRVTRDYVGDDGVRTLDVEVASD